MFWWIEKSIVKVIWTFKQWVNSDAICVLTLQVLQVLNVEQANIECDSFTRTNWHQSSLLFGHTYNGRNLLKYKTYQQSFFRLTSTFWANILDRKMGKARSLESFENSHIQSDRERSWPGRGDFLSSSDFLSSRLYLASAWSDSLSYWHLNWIVLL